MQQDTFVIGNGPSALRHDLGARIDRATNVVRLNDFRTAGYEAQVGTRTTMLFTCRLNEHLATLDRFPEVVLCLLMNPLDGVEIPGEALRAPNVVDTITWPMVEALLPRLGLREGCYPSTGFLAVLYALRRFGHVFVVGFDGLGGGNRHYYEDGVRAVPTRHDGDRERDWLDALQGVGLITDLTRAEPVQFYKFDGHDPFITTKTFP
jgi:hypothetical protein